MSNGGLMQPERGMANTVINCMAQSLNTSSVSASFFLHVWVKRNEKEEQFKPHNVVKYYGLG